MASLRSLTATWRTETTYFDPQTAHKKPHGPRFWQKQKMSKRPPPEASALDLRPSILSPLGPMTNMDEQTKQLPHPASSEKHPGLRNSHEYDGFVRKFHFHNLSDSTNNTTGSNESSPTTTISTVDDSSATEPSPGSSPESPPPTTFTVGMLRPRTADERVAPFFELQKQPPPRKGRNLKNLAVVTSRNSSKAASTASLPLQMQTDATATTILSPAFVKPPTPPRRKPSNLGLTLLTPGGSKPVPQLTIPPTPGFARPGTLRHFQSSPSLPLVPGFTLAQTSSMDYSRPRALETIFSPVGAPSHSPPIAEAEEEEEQNFDIPLSREEKPEAYPDGPICVYEPHIDLYLEPTADQARQYDVVMNVASEVRNPLLSNSGPVLAEPEVRIDGGGGIQFKPKQDRDHLKVRKPSAPGPASQDASPTTPKASPLKVTPSVGARTPREPEYIHVKWEHNSDIVPDLLRLCKLIDERVSESKRVLVHCQCGVSRSASLVVAYGLYKNPTMSVQEAYDAIKKRSKWIGPNMNLIMQLQEFRSSLARGGLLTARSTLSPITPGSALSEWHGPFTSNSIAMRDELPSAIEPASENGSVHGRESVGPGLSSPSGFAWPVPDQGAAIKSGNHIRSIVPAGPFVDPSGHVVPVLPLLKVVASPESMPAGPVRQLSTPGNLPTTGSLAESCTSPRSTEFAMAPIRPSPDVDPSDEFGILSPTSTECVSKGFDRSALLASLGMGSMRGDQETPGASLPLQQRDQHHALQQSGAGSTSLEPGNRLRGKISSPSLREEQQLRNLQAKIQADLLIRESPPTVVPSYDAANALMSPRATHFTENPFAMTTTDSSSSIPEPGESSRPTVQDPRSPAHKGASPIIRNIFDAL